MAARKHHPGSRPDRRTRPRAGLSRARVVDGALDLVDREGLPALSMRRLGLALGVEAMTLYHYFPSKAELLDGLVDRVLGSAGSPGPEGRWDDNTRAFALRLRAELLRHPGVLPLIATRPARSSEALAAVDAWLGALREAGLPLGLAMDLVNTIGTFVTGHLLAEVGTTPGHAEPEPSLDDVPLDPAVLPNLAEVVARRAGLDQEARFHRNLDILLDGYRTLVEARQ